MSTDDYSFQWMPGSELAPEVLGECAELFSAHYGVWSPRGPRPGKSIRLSPEKLRGFLPKGSFAILARQDGALIGHAFLLRTELPGRGVVSWVTQLVVHRAHRECGVARRLLFPLWGFSDHFAWGLVTSNPYAVRALERQTHRRCDPAMTRRYAGELEALGATWIPYIRPGTITVEERRCVIDTAYDVDHARVPEKLERATQKGVPWTLGLIDEGEEWFAFTFNEQPQFPLEAWEVEQLLARSDETAQWAYARMVLDPSKQAWLRHTDKEVDFALAQLGVAPGSAILDVGSGRGRHAVELALRGYRVSAIDFVPELVDGARRDSEARGASTAQFRCEDARTMALGESFDAAVCLYDVIGSFPEEASNQAILDNLARHLKPGGHVIASVMNMEPTDRVAQHRAVISDDPNALQRLIPSRAMEQTGNVFDPRFLLIDPQTRVVYRREQFDAGHDAPMEIIVRDRRYTRDDVRAMCARAGLELLWARPVQLGRWDEELSPTDERAKELLFLARRP